MLKYYNGVLLPELPEVSGYDYAFLIYSTDYAANKYRVVLSKKPYIYQASDKSIRPGSGNTVDNYWSTEDDGLSKDVVWVERNTSSYYYTNASFIVWSNYNIMDGSSVFFYANSATEYGDSGAYHSSGNIYRELTATSGELKIDADAGDMLVLTVAARSTVQTPEGFTLIHGEDYGLEYNQAMYFYSKKVTTSGVQNITITQAASARLYATCYAIRNVREVVYTGREKYAFTQPSGENVSFNVSKPEANMSVVYSVSLVFTPTVTSYPTYCFVSEPADLISVESGSHYGTQVRLSSWFDDGVKTLNHVVKYNPENQLDNRRIAFDGVEIIYNDTPAGKTEGFLIEENGTYYTVENGDLLMLPDQNLRSEIFETYSFQQIPQKSLLIELNDPHLLAWSKFGLRNIMANMNATPHEQFVFTKDEYITDPSIKGVQGVSVVKEGEPEFAFSFDDGPFEMYNGSTWEETNTGMSAETLQNIPTEVWTAKINGVSKYKIRFLLDDTADKVTEIKVSYLN